MDVNPVLYNINEDEAYDLKIKIDFFLKKKVKEIFHKTMTNLIRILLFSFKITKKFLLATTNKKFLIQQQ